MADALFNRFFDMVNQIKESDTYAKRCEILKSNLKEQIVKSCLKTLQIKSRRFRLKKSDFEGVEEGYSRDRYELQITTASVIKFLEWFNKIEDEKLSDEQLDTINYHVKKLTGRKIKKYEMLRDLLIGDLDIGLKSQTLNKLFEVADEIKFNNNFNLQPFRTFREFLNRVKSPNSARNYFFIEKPVGLRIGIVKSAFNDYQIIDENGKKLAKLHGSEILEDIKHLMKGRFYDCIVTYNDRHVLTDKEVEKLRERFTNGKYFNYADGIKINIFDVFKIEELNEGLCLRGYSERRKDLIQIRGPEKGTIRGLKSYQWKHIGFPKKLYDGKPEEVFIKNAVNEAFDNGYKGVLIFGDVSGCTFSNMSKGVYFKTSANTIEVEIKEVFPKKWSLDCKKDFKIMGEFMGPDNKKYKTTFIPNFDNEKIEEIINKQKEIKGKIISLYYMEMLRNENNEYYLKFPVLKITENANLFD